MLSLWNPHPFTSLLNMEDEYPGIAIEGVTGFDKNGATIPINDWSIDRKIAFWQEVMKHGHERGFDMYLFARNIFLSTAEGKHGIGKGPRNEATGTYLRIISFRRNRQMTKNETRDSLFGDVIYQYSRAQAIEDGTLIDVTETAREAEITFPTAVTAAVWADCVTVPQTASWQDESGRLWDVLTMLRYAIKQSTGGQQVNFSVAV